MSSSLTVQLKAYNCNVFTNFQHKKLYSFNLSLGFILKMFSTKIRKFQPQYSYKMYFYKEKKKEEYMYQ